MVLTIILCGKATVGSRLLSIYLSDSGDGFIRTTVCYILVCHILRRQDRPTAHPRHGEYASPLATNQRRDTDRRRRQLTRLPRPFPQYPPFTLRYGIMRLLRYASGAAYAGQWTWGSARTFDMIVLTERETRPRLLSCVPTPQAVYASKTMPQQSLTCIPIISGSLSHCLSRCSGRMLSESKLEQDAVQDNKVVSIQLISQPLKKRSLLRSERLAVEEVLGLEKGASPHCGRCPPGENSSQLSVKHFNQVLVQCFQNIQSFRNGAASIRPDK